MDALLDGAVVDELLLRLQERRPRQLCKVSPTDDVREDDGEVISVEEHLGRSLDERRPDCCWPEQQALPQENTAGVDDALG